MFPTKTLCEFASYFMVPIAIILLSARDTLQQDPLQCGIPRIRIQELIVQGHNTTPGSWPWHAAVYHRKAASTESYACGGTLISSQFVLTAAHCVLDTENKQQLVNKRIFVRLGLHNLAAVNKQAFQQHNIYKIYKPSNFTGAGLRNDIAILELETYAELNDFVQPACLSSSKDLTDQYGTVIGWGITEDDEVSRILKSAQMPVVHFSTCLASNRGLFGQTLDKGIFCAGYQNGTSICNGDSGGGLFFKVDNAWYLGGIVSYSEARNQYSNLCHAKSYGAFTNVYTYLDWIVSVTKIRISPNEDSPADNLRPDFETCEPQEGKPSETNKSTLLSRHCGFYTPNRIIQGNRTNVFEFPWMALIRYNIDPDKQMDNLCAGTLINKRYVLTSAHCAKASKQPIKVRLGEHTIGQDRDCKEQDGYSECAPPVRDYGIECIIRHQQYNSRARVHNIALIRLNRNVVMEDHIQPICLPVTEYLRKLNPQKYIITGWGDTELDRKPMQLLKTTVTPAERSMCQKWMDVANLKLDQSQLCLGQPDGPDACRGDGGGPLGYTASYNGMRFVQFGIVSFGSGCGVVPSIYTKVAPYMDWILVNMKP